MRIETVKNKSDVLRRSCAPPAIARGSRREEAHTISPEKVVPIYRDLRRLLRFTGSLLVAFCFLVGLAVASDQKASESTVKGFQAPLQYFEPPHELQIQSFLEGSEAQPGADGVIVIQNAKLQTFHEDGTKEMLVKAPQAIFDSRQHTINSAGSFQMQSSNVLVQGVGFFWQQTNSELLISNQQVTTVIGQMTNSFSP